MLALVCLALTNRGQSQSDRPATRQPTHSSVIALDAAGQRAYVVNPDSDSISVLDVSTRKKTHEVAVGREPRTLAIDRHGKSVLVANLQEDTLSVLSVADLSLVVKIPVPHEPYGVACSPVDDLAFVTSSQAGVLSIVDTAAHRVVAQLDLPPLPRGVAVTADGRRLLVTHFLSGQVSVIDVNERRLVTTIGIGADSNMAQQIVIDPAGKRAYLPHIRSHVATPTMLFDTTVFPVMSVIDVATSAHLRKEKIGLDAVDRPVNMPFAAAISPDGRLLFVVNSGSDDLSIIDLVEGTAAGHLDVGKNPRGVAFTPDGKQALIANHVSNDVAFVDVAARRVVERVPVTVDRRAADVKRGQALFFTSARAEVSRERWISCASCHFDGGIDGRTWNTSRGPRNTQSLLGVNETHPLHWSADRLNVQDFQKTLMNEMGGRGLPASELDDLAVFVNSLRLPPRRRPAGSSELTASAQRGKLVFESTRTQCATCHAPPLYTDRQLHDVGTANSSSEKLGPKFDTPSLRGIFATPPYLHDGSAHTLKDVLTTGNAADRHGVTSHLSSGEIEDLLAFLLSL